MIVITELINSTKLLGSNNSNLILGNLENQVEGVAQSPIYVLLFTAYFAIILFNLL